MDVLRQPRREESAADRCGLVAVTLLFLWHVRTHFSASTVMHKCAQSSCNLQRLRWTTWTHMRRWRRQARVFLGLWPPLLCSADGELHIIESVSKLVIKQFEWQRHMNRTRLNTRERERARERERGRRRRRKEERERAHWYQHATACHAGLRQRHLELAVLAATHSQVGGTRVPWKPFLKSFRICSGDFLDCRERGLLPAEIGVQTI